MKQAIALLPRYTWGVGYNILNLDENAPKTPQPETLRILARCKGRKMTEQERRVVYNDPAIRLKPSDVERIRGKPVYNTHNRKKVGEIQDAVIDRNAKTLRPLLKITDAQTDADLQAGKLTSLSVGYDFALGADGAVEGIEFQELSVCKEPFFEGCRIEVMASKNQVYNPFKRLVSKLVTVSASSPSFSSLSPTTTMSDPTQTLPLSQSSVSPPPSAPEKQKPAATTAAGEPQQQTTAPDLRALAEQNQQLQDRLAFLEQKAQESEQKVRDAEQKAIAPKVDGIYNALSSLVGEEDAEFSALLKNTVSESFQDPELAASLGKVFDKISGEVVNISQNISQLETEKNAALEKAVNAEKERDAFKAQLDKFSRTSTPAPAQMQQPPQPQTTTAPKFSQITKPRPTSSSNPSSSLERLKRFTQAMKPTPGPSSIESSSSGQQKRAIEASASAEAEAEEPVRKAARIEIAASAMTPDRNARLLETLLNMNVGLSNPYQYADHTTDRFHTSRY